MRKISTFFLFACFSITCISQQGTVDSLLYLLKTAREDTNKVNIIQQLSEVCDDKDILKYSEEAFELSEKLNYKKGMAVALNNIGYIKANNGKTKDALQLYLKSLTLWEELNDKEGIATSLNELGYIYNETNQNDKAIKSYKKSLEIRNKIGEKKDIGYSLNNIGVSYQMRGEQDTALEYFLQSLKIWKDAGYKQGISTALNNIGYIYYNQRDLTNALKYYQQGLQLQKEISNPFGIASLLNNIGAVYFKLGDKIKAIRYSEQALQISKENKYPEFVARAAKLLTDIYANSAEKSLIRNHKDWKKAFEYTQLYSQMKDTLLNEESSKQITEMQTKYETEKKEQQIKLLEKDSELQKAESRRQKVILILISGFLFLIFLFSIFIFRERRKSENLLLNILPVETANELKSKGKASPKYYESVTVMFTDFKDFTQIAEKLSAEELVNELDFIFKKFDEIIARHNIEKIKTIGDSYMCAGGLPIANNNHAENIIRAALDIQNFMNELAVGNVQLVNGNSNLQTAPNKVTESDVSFVVWNRTNWQLRIGIHTGPVVAGVVGEKKFAYDIWGDTVNTASRMESSGEAGKVNISGSTYEVIKNSPLLLGEGLGVKYRGKISAKHKGEIEMYFVDKC